MPALYVTNCTRQIHRFMFRTATSQHPVQIDLAGGEQKMISDKLTTEEIEKIIEHHSRYGMVAANDHPNMKAPLRYSIDKPMSFDRVADGVQHVDQALVEEGEHRRAAAAIAISTNIEQNLFERQLPDRLTEVAVSTQEDGDNPVFTSGIKVSRTPESKAQAANKRENAPRKA